MLIEAEAHARQAGRLCELDPDPQCQRDARILFLAANRLRIRRLGGCGMTETVWNGPGVDRTLDQIVPVYIPPQLVTQRGSYVVLWHSEGLRLEFDRVRSERRSGDVTAELTVERLLDPTEPILLGRRPNYYDMLRSGIRVNLTSLQARGTLAKGLETRHPRGDWLDLVETSLRMVREAVRTGEPAVLLRDVAEPQASALLAFLPAHPVVLFGDGSSGKSLLALAIAATLHTGQRAVLGYAPAQRRRVLFLDYEWEPAVHKQRLDVW